MEGRVLRRRWRGGRPLALILLLVVLAFFLPPFPAYYDDLKAGLSLRITDREGRPLRQLLSEREGTERWLELDEICPELVRAVIISEDQRFYQHPGIDPLAIARAARDNAQAGRVVSGASTITQQLLRTLHPTGMQGDWWSKLTEAYWSLRIEGRTTKKELLEAYLNRAAFGPAVYGVEEASRYYFEKPCQSLSLAEAVMLSVMLRSPTGFDPWTEEGRQELKPWTDELITRLAKDGLITLESAQRAKDEPWQLSLAPPPFLAPHFCELALPQLQGLRGEQRTSLDLTLQRDVEGMLANHVRLLQGHKAGNAAVLVASVENGEVLALAGSADFRREGDGQYNAAVSLRQPGSTLKPFTYALLLSKVGHAGHILPDLPVYSSSHTASFIPKNYDERFHGPVSLRTALGSSYNVPAVKALETVGVETLLRKLRQLGLDDLKESAGHYGLGLTLGDGSASLWQLVTAYRTLARGGEYSPLSLRHAPETEVSSEVLGRDAVAIITDVLSDPKARVPSFGTPNALELPFPVAVKTGTSKGYRDNWCIGYTPRHVVGVWVGNSDGSPMKNVSGITGAGPLFRDVMLRLGDGGDFPQVGLTKQKICALSGRPAEENCPRTVVEPCLPGFTGEGCKTCVLTTIDSRTGEPAQDSTPAAFKLEQLRFDVDPVYREWAEEAGLPLLRETGMPKNGFGLVFPQNGDVFLLDSDLRQAHQKVKLRVAGGQAPYRWWVGGKQLQTAQAQAWWPLQPGNHEVKVQDAQGKSDRLSLSVVGKATPR